MIYTFKVSVIDGAFFEGEEAERVMEADGDLLLDSLWYDIMLAFGFDTDHLYEFRYRKAVYVDPRGSMELWNNESKAAEETLRSIGIRKGSRLNLIYDFGDYWVFDIKVIDRREGSLEKTKLISSHGYVSQYGDNTIDDFDEYDEIDDSDEFDSYRNTEWDYRAPDSLYEVMYRYRNTRLWDKLLENQLFAVKFSDGEKGYISIMGAAGQHCAMSVYIGDESLQAFLRIQSEPEPIDEFLAIERAVQLDCLQAGFEDPEFLYDGEIKAAEKYLTEHGIAYYEDEPMAHFIKQRPDCYPWYPDGEKDEQYLLEALETAIFMSSLLMKNKMGLKMPLVGKQKGNIPLIEYNKDGCHLLGETAVPQKEPERYPVPRTINEVAIKRLKQIGTKETLSCRIAILSMPIQESPDDVPRLSRMCFTMVEGRNWVLPMKPHRDFYENPENVANCFIEVLLDAKIRPGSFQVCDERTEAFLKPVARALGADIVMKLNLPGLDEVITDFCDASAVSETNTFMEMLMSVAAQMDDPSVIPDANILAMPEEFKLVMKNLAKGGAFSEKVNRRLLSLL